MSEATKKIDPRVSALALNRAPYERFIILMFGVMASPEVLNAVLAEIVPQGIDYTREAEGKSLHHWLGKSRDQIAKELDGDKAKVENVVDALAEVGVDVQNGEKKSVRRKSKRESEGEGERPARGENRPARRAEQEPSFGNDQIPLSELPESDEDILKIPGIGEATLAEIKKLRSK